MAAYITQLVFNCTLAQFNTMCSTTLPAAGLKVIQAPQKFQGLVISAPFTFTATTNSTTALSALSSVSGLYNGIPVSGAGIPAGDTIATFNAAALTAVLAVAATATAAGVTITATPNLGQLDFSYDGAYYVRFFGANPAPKSQQPQAGIPQNMMSTNMVNVLTQALLATLGAPVPVNQVVPPTGAGYYP